MNSLESPVSFDTNEANSPLGSRPRLATMRARLEEFGHLEPDALARHQLAAMRVAVAHHYRHNSTYRSMCAARHVTPNDLQTLEDLRRFPIVERDYLARYAFHQGEGGALSVPVSDLASFLNSSGSTGRSKRIPLAESELPSIAETCAMALWVAGVHGHHAPGGGTILPIFPHGPWPGALFLQSGSEIIGFAPKADMGLPFEWHRRNLEELAPRSLVTTPSFITALERHLREHGAPSRYGLTRILLGGEYFSEGFRAEVERRFGCRVLDIYGCGETQIVTTEADDLYERRRGWMYHLAHMSYLEVVEPGTESPVPPGATGEMVITVFNRRAFPMVRYRMGDLISLAPPELHGGDLTWRFPLVSRIQGRADDMLKYGNVMLFPETFFQALARYAAAPPVPLSFDKFRFELSSADDPLGVRASLQVELAEGRASALPEEVRERAAKALLASITAQSDELYHALYIGRQVPPPSIELLDAGALYVKEQKLRRMVDRRRSSRS